jgi:hypothetical protein
MFRIYVQTRVPDMCFGGFNFCVAPTALRTHTHAYPRLHRGLPCERASGALDPLRSGCDGRVDRLSILNSFLDFSKPHRESSSWQLAESKTVRPKPSE